MKILVIGGTHGNELLGIKLVESLQKIPIKNVDVYIANPRAVERKVRFTETDLNRSFGKQTASSYEIDRAEELCELVKQYDVVLDFHNTQTPNNNCAFVGVDANPMLYDVAKSLGYEQIIQATYDCINKYCLNTVSMEISASDKWDDVNVWRQKITELIGKPLSVDRSIAVYRYLQRVTWNGSEKLPGAAAWQPFVELYEEDKMQLDIEAEVVPIFIGSRLTEYYATLLERVS